MELKLILANIKVSMSCNFIKKLLKYYTCKRREVQVNCKGHLTKHPRQCMHMRKIILKVISTNINVFM